MNGDHQRFLAAVAAEPEDTNRRLLYADYLETEASPTKACPTCKGQPVLSERETAIAGDVILPGTRYYNSAGRTFHCTYCESAGRAARAARVLESPTDLEGRP